MTALCVMDNGNLNRSFTIKKSDTWVVPTKVGIQPGEVYTRRKLLGALLVTPLSPHESPSEHLTQKANS
ncbi:MAG: hypothetical protein JRC77_03920 [Deltaproteobacteria bacterium]|nr:hypothetical protein [Deltaproteobacteria bacterium]